jgi:hypothetical protein
MFYLWQTWRWPNWYFFCLAAAEAADHEWAWKKEDKDGKEGRGQLWLRKISNALTLHEGNLKRRELRTDIDRRELTRVARIFFRSQTAPQSLANVPIGNADCRTDPLLGRHFFQQSALNVESPSGAEEQITYNEPQLKKKMGEEDIPADLTGSRRKKFSLLNRRRWHE